MGRVDRMSVGGSAVRLVLAGMACVVVACSAFSSSDPPAPETVEAGVDGAVSEEGGVAEAEATTCTNTATDAANCGRCGHSCLGGACAAGRCQPIELARFTDDPVATVALSATHVYWNTIEGFSAGPGNVYSCAKAGCSGTATLLAKGATAVVRGLGSDGQRVLAGAFYGGGGLYELSPTAITARLSVAEGGNPMQMSLRPTEMFYVSFWEPTIGDRTVRRWDYKGTVTTPCTFALGDTTAAAAFTDARAYLAANAVGELHSCPLVGSSGQFVLEHDNVYLGSLTATADRVFWAEGGLVTSGADGAVKSTVRAELGPVQVKSDIETVTFTGGALFMTTKAGGLWSCDPKDCEHTFVQLAQVARLETSLGLVSHTVAADADAAYFIAADLPDGGLRESRLMKVAR